MLKILSKWLNIYKDERELFLWSAVLLFLIRTSSILFNNFAETAFLKRFGVEYLPIVYIVNSITAFLIMGFMAGITTMMANAAGPVMIIYLMAMRLPKIQFVGTSVWFFFVVNWLKVPFSTKLEMMTWQSVKLDLLMLPFIAAGAVAGIFFLKRIPQKAFTAIVQILAAAAAIILLF